MKGGKKKKKMMQAKRVKEPDKPSKRVTMVSKDTKNDDDKDQNFFKKPQMHKVSRMEPDASDENFFDLQEEKEFLEACHKKDVHKMVEIVFQSEFKEKWDKNLEEEKLLRKLATKYPTRSFSYLRSVSGKDMLMYIKGKEESVKSRTYQEMLTEVKESITEILGQIPLLKDEVGSANSEEEFKEVKAEMEEQIDNVKFLEIMMQLIQTKIDEHSHNAGKWLDMVPDCIIRIFQQNFHEKNDEVEMDEDPLPDCIRSELQWWNEMIMLEKNEESIISEEEIGTNKVHTLVAEMVNEPLHGCAHIHEVTVEQSFVSHKGPHSIWDAGRTEWDDNCQSNYPKMADNHRIKCKFKDIFEYGDEGETVRQYLTKLKDRLNSVQEDVSRLEDEFMEFHRDLVMNEDNNFFKDGGMPSSELSSTPDEYEDTCVVKLDHNFFEDGYDMSSSSEMLVPQHQSSMVNIHKHSGQQPSTWVARMDVLVVQEDHNHYEDPAVSSSSPTVPQQLVLLVLAYLKNRQMIESRDFNIPSDPG